MLPFKFDLDSGKKINILCLGAHCDDIEIGCGGTVLKLIKEYRVHDINWIVFASNERRKMEAIASAERFLKDVEKREITIFGYRDAFLSASAAEIKSRFELLKEEFNPDVIFTHYRDDRHQDHRLISDLTWNTFRNHLIFEYEIPKYDGDLGNPNAFCGLNESEVELKIQILMDCFVSQKGKHWFDEETFKSLLRIRGLECALKYAEAFHLRKALI